MVLHSAEDVGDGPQAESVQGPGGGFTNRYNTLSLFSIQTLICLCRSAASRSKEMQAGRLRDFWEVRRGHEGAAELSEGSKLLLEASWREGTEATYSYCWKVWLEHCRSAGIQCYSPVISEVCDFLAKLFDQGLAYRTINTYRSSLSSTLLPIEGFQVGQHPLVSCLMKGVFNSRPPVKTLVPTWSIRLVLEMIRSWGENSSLDLAVLTYKTVMLLALATARRCSSLHLLTLKQGYCDLSDSMIKFQPFGLEKQSRSNHIAPPIEIEEYTADHLLDPVACVKHYVHRTRSIRKSDMLFVITRLPHSAAKKTTIGTWISKVISLSGQTGSGGSVRSASASRALSRGASLEEVLSAGDWARESTFRLFYYKPGPFSFVDSVLS